MHEIGQPSAISESKFSVPWFHHKASNVCLWNTDTEAEHDCEPPKN